MNESQYNLLLESVPKFNESRDAYMLLDLRSADLRGANLRVVDLQGANLQGADLRGADLYGANLRGANLRVVDLRSADLRGANLRVVDLQGANLRVVDLQGANLQGADLRGADLRGANLRGANLQGARLPHFQIPDGSLVGWKKLGDVLIKLRIPPQARRTACLINRKCRAEFAYVECMSQGKLATARGTTYRIDTWVYPDKYDDDIRIDCTHGIHFFLTRAEAEEWQ